MLALALLAFIRPAAAWPGQKGSEPSPPPSEVPPLIMVLTPLLRAGTLANRYPQGSRLALLGAPGLSPQNLTPGFYAAADPRMAFEGTQVLFAGKKTPQDRWQIWEMHIDGSGVRQVTHCPEDCLKPAYLPRGEIVFTAVPFEPPAAPSQIWVGKLDGSEPHPITFGPGDYQVETVLMNGTILASARSPLIPINGQVAERQFYTLRPDGSGLAAFRCDHQSASIRSQADELADGAVVFIKRPVSAPESAGELAWVRRGALHNAPLTSPEIPVISPQALSGDRLVVARPAGPDKPRAGRFALYTFDAERAAFAQMIFEDPGLSSVAAAPVAAHDPPRWYWSTLNPALKTGYFICLDSHLSQEGAHGRLAAEPARLRVLTLDSRSQRDERLGEAPVEKDGSFYIAVPPDRPVRFELLDAAGRVIRAQSSWIWARSGEEHGCVGCHEDRALAPANRWPLALRSFDTPTRVGLAGK